MATCDEVISRSPCVELTSVLSSIHLYTEGGDAPGWPGAKSEHIGNIRAREKMVSTPASTGCSAGRMYRYIELRTLAHTSYHVR